jgi:uncharacterized membrane protein YidH (DUF202 family)
MQLRQSFTRSERRKRTIVMAAALAGMLGPVLFVAVLLGLTDLQYDFMLRIGWRPLTDPSGAWPSGLALGPYGPLQDANFVVSGLLLALFSLGLSMGTTDGPSSSLGPALLLVAGIAMALMGFESDPMQRVGPRSLHGLVHDAAFVLFILAMLAALFSLWRKFRTDLRWRDHARFTLVTGMLAVLLFLLPGVAYYLFIFTLLAWIFVTAMRLWPSSQPLATDPSRRSS